MKALIAGIALLAIIGPAESQGASNLDKFVGYYQLNSNIVVSFTRNGDHLTAQGTGQPAIELTRDGANTFSAHEGQWRFESDASGNITDVVLSQYGNEDKAPKIGMLQALAITAAQEALVKENKPSQGTEAALRAQITALEKGMPDYAAMTPPLATVVQKNETLATQMFQKLGALTSLTFMSVEPGGGNVYVATFEHGNLEWVIAPLTSDGKIDHLAFKPL